MRLNDGSLTINHYVLKIICADYYTNLLGYSGGRSSNLTAYIESVHPFRCFDLQRQILERGFNLKEIKA